MKKFIVSLLCIVLAFTAFGCTGASGEFSRGAYNAADSGNYFVKNGQTEYSIVIPETPTATETYAAGILKNYIDIATGVNILIKSDAGRTYNSSDKVLSLGKTVYQKGAGLSDSDYAGLNGGYILKSFGNAYVFDADTKNGLVYSVYHFLTDCFGVEFLTWDEVYIPENVTEVAAPELNVKDVPTFQIRDFYSYPVWYKSQAVTATLGMNSPSFKTTEEFDSPFYYGYYYDVNDVKYSSTREGHSIESLLCVDAYRNGVIPSVNYKTSDGGALNGINLGYWAVHPEWYAYDPGYNRSNSQGYSQEEFCYSNGLTDDGDFDRSKDNTFTAKIIEIVKTMIREETSENANYLMLGHGDWYAQCKCDRCKAMYVKYGENFSGLYCVWANAVVKEVNKWLADENITRPVKYVIFAYSKSIAAPVRADENGNWVPLDPKIKLDDSIVIKMAYRYCNSHTLWDEACQYNEVKRNEFRQWQTLANEFAIWDYSCQFPDYLWYLPDYGTLKSNYEYYKSLNVKHLLTQGTPSEYNYYEYHLKAYVSLNLMWNVDQDVNALIEKFNRLYFGEKYAPYVNLYRDIFENHTAILDYERKAAGGFHASTDNDLNMKTAENYSRAMLEAAISAIDKALAAVKSDNALTPDEKSALELKLRSVKITPQYMMLRLGYIIYESELKALAADFFESIDLLKLTYMREGSTVANSFAQMKESYGL